MAYGNFNALAELNRNTQNRRMAPRGSNQTAAVNLMGLSKEVLELARLSKLGKQLPEMVPEHVYPGGVLPPGDVVRVQHYTGAPDDIQALDPAKWGSRGSLGGSGNKEAPRMRANSDLYNTQFYLPDYGSIPERNIVNQPNARMIEGAVPGMYNMTKDPEGIQQMLKDDYMRAVQEVGGNEQYMPKGELIPALDREVRRRGYTGPYWEDTGEIYGAAGYANTPVDLTGAAPNISAMRKNLGFDNAPSIPEERFPPGSAYAQVNTETMPGAEFFAKRYAGYEGSPSAGAMLHSDYEKLLRNPDNSSVVADMMGYGRAPVRQAQGVYKGQRNPVAGARVAVNKPRLDASMDPDQIEAAGRLSPGDRAKMDSIALAEGLLRDQDAVSWTFPVHMTNEKAMAVEGLPWESVNSSIFRSPQLGQNEVAQVANKLDTPLPDDLKTNWADTWEDMISVTEPADGSGGIMMTNVGGLDPKVFQDKIRELRREFPYWARSRNMQTEWGRADTGYFEQPEYEKAVADLPDDARQRLEGTVRQLRPYVDQIKSYHDNLRAGPRVQQPEEPAGLGLMEQMRAKFGAGWGM